MGKMARRPDHPVPLCRWMDSSGFPDDRPRAVLLKRHCGSITTDQSAGDSLCRTRHDCDQIADFIRSLPGHDTLHRSVGPAIFPRPNVMGQADPSNRHVDTNDDRAVSPLLPCAGRGGIFEHAPLVRSEEDENHAAVSARLNRFAQPHRAEMPSGTFMRFLGRRGRHRVSSVGATCRLRHSLFSAVGVSPACSFRNRPAGV